MKKAWVLTTILIVTLAFVVNVSAERKGTVKVDFDPNVGWTNLNTTASGRLNATAHLYNGAPNQDFMVNVRIRYEDGTVAQFTNIATLSTNGGGIGNVQVQVDIDPPTGSNTLRRVAVRLRTPSPPIALYVATAWDLPLK